MRELKKGDNLICIENLMMIDFNQQKEKVECLTVASLYMIEEINKDFLYITNNLGEPNWFSLMEDNYSFYRKWFIPASEYFQVNIHEWFGLSYSSYLVLPRSILQSMPEKWQHDFVALIQEIERLGVETPNYRVQAVNEAGKYIKDEYADYERGRRKIEFKKKVI